MVVELELESNELDCSLYSAVRESEKVIRQGYGVGKFGIQRAVQEQSHY